MATYDQILEKWFYLLLPEGVSMEQHESEPGIEDRMASRDIIRRMASEAPTTAKELCGISELPVSEKSLKILDRFITPENAEDWMESSDPDDPNNHFKLTVCEFSAHFGDVIVRTLNGAWRYARAPNYFLSKVVTEGADFYVFNVIMKKCSDDYRHESLTEKFKQYSEMITKYRKLHSNSE
jgi:hypothetical protein